MELIFKSTLALLYQILGTFVGNIVFQPLSWAFSTDELLLYEIFLKNLFQVFLAFHPLNNSNNKKTIRTGIYIIG